MKNLIVSAYKYSTFQISGHTADVLRTEPDNKMLRSTKGEFIRPPATRQIPVTPPNVTMAYHPAYKDKDSCGYQTVNYILQRRVKFLIGFFSL